MSESRTKPLAYLVSRYPAISHTFILREVLALRALGIPIEVASINDPDRNGDALTEEERREARNTFYVKRAGGLGALAAQAPLLLSAPLRYLRALAFALSLGGADPRSLLYHFLYFVEAGMIASWMRRRNLGHLHVHFATPAATVGLIATRLRPITMSITVHGPDEFYDVGLYRLRQKIEGASFLCAIGSFARSQLMKLSPSSEWPKFEVTPLGVDVDEFSPRTPRTAPAPFEILCVGRLVPAKGQHVLLAAAARLRREGRNIAIRFVGDGPDRASLAAEIGRLALHDCVRLEGAVNQDHIREFYRRADAFVLPSFAEGIPVVLMEAMAMEIPCISTCITGIPELIRDSTDGILVPPSDDEALAGAIARLMDDEPLRRRLGVAGRERVRERYELRRNTRRLAEVFRRRLEVTP